MNVWVLLLLCVVQGLTEFLPVSSSGHLLFVEQVFGISENLFGADEKTDKTCLQEVWDEFPHFTQQEVRAALARCGLTTKHIESKIQVLSGGEKAKVRLCKLMNRENNVLVLDEPTNHLDMSSCSQPF